MGARHPDAAEWFEWRAPDGSVSIWIAYGVLEEILERHGRVWPGRKRPEVGGLLVGTVDEQDGIRIRIDGAADVPCRHFFGPTYSLGQADRLRFSTAIEDRSLSGEQRALGFYRTHARNGLGLDADDLLLLSELFPAPGGVALLLKPRLLRPALGGFFIWEGGAVRSESSHLEFEILRKRRSVRLLGPAAPADVPEREVEEPAPADVPEREVEEPAPASVFEREVEEPAPAGVFEREVEAPVPAGVPERQAEEPAPEAAPQPLPAPVADASPRFQRLHPLWRSWWVRAPLLACLVAAGEFLGFVAARELNRFSPPQSPPRDPYALSLTVVEYADSLHLIWDRQAPSVALAQGGRLSISDGEQSRGLDLTAAQLQRGSVIYRKLTNQVRFRLEVFLKQGRSVSEIWEAPRAASGASRPVQPGR
ncbi:MAG: hypothetical protein ABSD56_11470 [Bryobacteraceae bacterium]